MAKAEGSAIVKFLLDPSGFEKGISKMEGTVERFSNRIKNVGSAFQSVGATFTAAGAAMAAPFVVAGAQAVKFEKAFAEVKTLFKEIDSSSLGNLEDGVRRVAVLIGEDLTTATKGLYQAISSGVPADNAISFLEEAGKAAVGGVTTLEVAVDGITTVINAYGDQLDKYGDAAQKATYISDVLFQTVLDGKVEFTELASYIGQVASTAAASNVSIEELNAAIAFLSARGINARIAITSINQAILGLTNATPEARAEFDRLGINLDGFLKKEISFTEIMQEVAEKTGGSTTALGRLFTAHEALKAVIPIVSNNMSGFNAQLEKFGDVSGNSQRAFDTMMQTVSKQFDIIKAKMLDFGISVSKLFEADVKAALKAVNIELDKWAIWIKRNPEEFASAIKNIASIATGLLVFGTASIAIGTFLKGLANAALLLKGVGTAARFVIGAISTFSQLIAFATGTVTTLTGTAATLATAFSTAAAVIAELAAAITVTVSGAVAVIGLLVYAIYDWNKSQQIIKESQDRLSESTDLFIAKLKERNALTDTQINNIAKIENAEQRYNATMQALNAEQAKRNTDEYAAAQLELEQLIEGQATKEQIAEVWKAMLYTNGDARLAALAVLTQADQEELNSLMYMTEQEAAAYAARSETHIKWLSQRGILTNATVQGFSDELTALGVVVESEKEAAAIRETAIKYQLDLETAAAAYKANLRDAEMIKVQQGASVEILANEAKAASREEDKNTLAESLTSQVQTWEQYRASLEEELGAIRQQQDAIIEKIRQLKSEGQSVPKELQDSYTHMGNQYAQLNGELEKVDNAFVKQRAQTIAEHNDINLELSKNVIDEAEAMGVAETAYANLGKENRDKIIKNNDDIAHAWESLTTVQKEQLTAQIGKLTELDISIKDITGYIKQQLDIQGQDLQRLSTNTQLATQSMLVSWKNYATQLEQEALRVRNAQSYIDPTVRHSPSLVDNVMSGTRDMAAHWAKYSAALDANSSTIYEAMQYANPYARHSPSLVDNVMSGTREMLDSTNDWVKRRLEALKKMYAEEIKMLQEAGGIRYKLERTASGNIDVNKSEILAGPAGLDKNTFFEMLKKLQRLIDFAKGPQQGDEFALSLGSLFDTLIKKQAEKAPTKNASQPSSSMFSDFQSPATEKEIAKNTHIILDGIVDPVVEETEKAVRGAWGTAREKIKNIIDEIPVSGRAPAIFSTPTSPVLQDGVLPTPNYTELLDLMAQQDAVFGGDGLLMSMQAGGVNTSTEAPRAVDGDWRLMRGGKYKIKSDAHNTIDAGISTATTPFAAIDALPITQHFNIGSVRTDEQIKQLAIEAVREAQRANARR